MPTPDDAARDRVTAPRLPQGRGWLVRDLGYEAAGFGSQLQAVLEAPDVAALLVMHPAVARVLRPVCHMLGLSLVDGRVAPPPSSVAREPRPPAQPKMWRPRPAMPVQAEVFRPGWERPVAAWGCDPDENRLEAGLLRVLFVPISIYIADIVARRLTPDRAAFTVGGRRTVYVAFA